SRIVGRDPRERSGGARTRSSNDRRSCTSRRSQRLPCPRPDAELLRRPTGSHETPPRDAAQAPGAALTDISLPDAPRRTHLQQLEAERIHIIREVVAQCERPVMLYSIGKDSSVMLHLARKAFHPAPLPFPLLHVDTTWKFREMIEFRDRTAKTLGLDLIVHTNREGVEQNVNPLDHPSDYYTHVMKTLALRQALDQHGFDAAIGGARRDEERSRAKERVFSHRTVEHAWDPKAQRPELWRLFNTRLNKGESFRVFPLSNWT